MGKSKNVKKILFGCVLCLLTLIAGSCVYVGGYDMQAKYEKIVHLAMPLSPCTGFETQSHNGSITINGADVTDCNVTATIVARARNDEEAEELAERTKVEFERMGESLALKIKVPQPLLDRSVSVSLDCLVPNKVDLKLTSHNGAINITNINGKIDATTHNGKMTARQVTGAARLQTHNGGIVCEEISGDTQLTTHNGSVKAEYSETAGPVCDISIVSHNGGIELTAPHGYSGRIEATTHNGSIHTDLPITLKGEVSRNKINGTIGDGQGKLFLQTHNGSIRLR